MFNGIEKRPARRRRVELEPTQQRRSEAKLPPMFPEFGKIDVVGRLGECSHPVIGGFQEIATHRLEDDGTNLGVRCRLIEQNGRGITQLQRRGIEVAKRAQAGFPRGRLRIGKDRCGDDVEQIDDVVAGAGLECADKRQKCCGPPIVRKSGDRLCLGGGREAGERIDATRRQPVDFRQSFRDDTDFVETRQRPTDLGAALDIGTVAKAIERTLAGAFRHDNERVETLALFGRHLVDEAAKQTGIGARANTGDRPLEHRQSRQQNLVGKEKGNGPIEQRRRPIGAGPAKSVEKAAQPERHAGIGDGAIAVAGPNTRDMPPASPIVRIGKNRVRIIEAELLCRVPHRGRRGGRKVFEKHAEHANRSELNGDAQAVAIAAVLGDERAIGVVEIEMPHQLVGRRLSRETTVAPDLVFGEEADRHWFAYFAATERFLRRSAARGRGWPLLST